MEDFAISVCEQLTDTGSASDFSFRAKVSRYFFFRSFWSRLTEDYPEILKCAVRKPLPSPSTNLFEPGFSR
jgi:hypothetical protein